MRRRTLLCVLGVVGGIAACLPRGGGPEGQVLRVALAREPTTWNRLLAADWTTHVVTDQLHAPLIRLNPETQEMEPALAESWKLSQDGTELVFHLRRGVRFSDGEPFGASDVAFTLQAIYDPSVGSPLVDTVRIDGEPLDVEVVDKTTICIRLPRPTAAIERVFDSIRILPEHRLGESLRNGTLAEDSGLGAEPRSIVGLGPFRLREHVPGSRIVLERNPYYWKARRPALDELVFEVLPDESTRVLRLRAGEVDLLERLSPAAFGALVEGERDDLVLDDLGPGLTTERLWFNLNPESPIDAHKKAWFEDVRFRRAVSLAIDRKALVRVVFGGLASEATGPVSPVNRRFRHAGLPPLRHDVEKARELLRAAGFRSRGDGLVDRDGHPVRFTIVTNSGDTLRLRTGTFLQEDLAQIGIETTVVPVEGSGLLARITSSFDYEACLLGIAQTDPDPSAEMSLWLSRGPLHLWNPAQATPATPWEARLDTLMEAQIRAREPEKRREYYYEVQAILAEHRPSLDLVVPHVLVGYSRRLEGVRATPLGDLLWNSEEIRIVPEEVARTLSTRDTGH